MSTSGKSMKDEDVDIWRDTPVRFLGYSNEIGEAFRAQVPVSFVRLTYGMAFIYVLADTRHKTLKVKSPDIKKKMIAATDTLTWQTLASVAIPGFTINRVCFMSLALLARTKLSLPVRKWTTTAIGLGCIPFIVHPIDKFVDYFMDNTFRVAFPPSQ
ncbi:unnamed protein product [Orchesella dallaii]|uniref:Mitochondrial fission process protein 1 n=1 Tax=Orchesella dallaii TaxID=48710 RepID=A0ABP1Q544_9HEXA